jgi:hypothetical protein
MERRFLLRSLMAAGMASFLAAPAFAVPPPPKSAPALMDKIDPRQSMLEVVLYKKATPDLLAYYDPRSRVSAYSTGLANEDIAASMKGMIERAKEEGLGLEIYVSEFLPSGEVVLFEMQFDWMFPAMEKGMTTDPVAYIDYMRTVIRRIRPEHKELMMANLGVYHGLVENHYNYRVIPAGVVASINSPMTSFE